MTEDVDEVELFEYRNTVCAVRTMKSKHTEAEPWYQGVAYISNTKHQSNWYTKREDAVRMAEVMVRQARHIYK